MKISTSNIVPWCLTGALLIGGSVTGARAEDAGIIRISKAKAENAAPLIVQTSFVDVADDATDGVETVYNTVYGATQESQANTRAHFATFGSPMAVLPASYHGAACDNCQIAESNCDCPSCQSKKCRGGKCRWGRHGHGGCPHCGNGCCHSGHAMLYYFKSKFGCLTPTGNGGPGSPHIGKYSRVYPENVHHFDQRDGQIWAAQGYGIPMAVPLAPVVGHTYNYGWGIPSSRLTPISHIAPR
jgi:hypothetical protein